MKLLVSYWTGPGSGLHYTVIDIVPDDFSVESLKYNMSHTYDVVNVDVKHREWARITKRAYEELYEKVPYP